MENKRCLFNVIIFLSLFFVAKSAAAYPLPPSLEQSDEFSCVYTFYLKTGSIIKAGTDSKIDLEFWNKYGDGSKIKDIEKWGGLMGTRHDYFERGNLDIFSGRGPCLTGPVCALKVVSDGSGRNHGWFLDYVKVITTGPHKSCAQENFEINQWLATDTSPYELTAERDDCSYEDLTKDRTVNLKSIVSSA